MSLYHCTHLQLNSGDTIKRGNWGRIILETGDTHPSWYRESILERIRCERYPEKPSRFDCCFACDNLETMKFYKRKNTPDGYIYEVEIIDESCVKHKGDYNAVEPMPHLHMNMEQIADKYWQYKLKTSVKGYPGIEHSEVLVSSDLRVVKLIK